MTVQNLVVSFEVVVVKKGNSIEVVAKEIVHYDDNIDNSLYLKVKVDVYIVVLEKDSQNNVQKITYRVGKESKVDYNYVHIGVEKQDFVEHYDYSSIDIDCMGNSVGIVQGKDQEVVKKVRSIKEVVVAIVEDGEQNDGDAKLFNKNIVEVLVMA